MAKEIERKRRIETTERMLAETNFEVTPDLAQALSDHMGISYNATHKFLRREAERGSFTRIKFATAESHITTDDITIKPVYTRKKGGCWERRKGRYANVCPGSHICKRLIVGAMTQDELNDELDKIGHSPRPVELMLCEGASLENDVNGEVIL